jgi:hypothetical protein
LFKKNFKLFDSDRFVIRLINYFAILLTFGSTFPPLALVIAITIISKTYLNQLLLSYYLKFNQYKHINQISISLLYNYG